MPLAETAVSEKDVQSQSYSDSELFDLCKTASLDPRYQGLTQTDFSIYPQNIIFTIPKSNVSQIPPVCSLTNITFAFTQEFVQSDTKAFLDFVQKLKKADLPLSVTVLLAANDEKHFLLEDMPLIHNTGTSVYAKTLNKTESTAVIVVRQRMLKTTQNSIIPGGAGDVSPLWLVRSLKIACSQNLLDSHLPNSAAFLYRMHLMNEDERVSCFLEEGIPAVGLHAANVKDGYSILLTAAENLLTTSTSKWDRHYSCIYIPVLDFEIWLNETFFCLCYFLLSLIILFYLCFSTFTFKAKNIAAVKDVFRSWYYILILIAFTTASLYFSQKISDRLFSLPILIFGQKFIITFCATILLFLIQGYLNILFSYNLSSALLVFSATANIFIFTGIDLTFLFLFIFEYFICNLASKTKTRLSAIFYLFLMFLPFIPYAINILMSSNPMLLFKISRLSLLKNMLISFIIFPFQIQFLRLLILFEFFGERRQHGFFRRFVYSLIYLFISTAAFSLLLLLCVTFVFKESFSFFNLFQNHAADRVPAARMKIDDSTDDDIQISCKNSQFMEYTLSELALQKSADCKVLRYDISISCEKEIPVYDCNYDYSFENKNKVLIHIPDNPRSTVNIVFTRVKDAQENIEIITYIRKTDGTIVSETDTCQLSGTADRE